MAFNPFAGIRRNINIASGAVDRALPFDPTPGFNIATNIGGGILPFIERSRAASPPTGATPVEKSNGGPSTSPLDNPANPGTFGSGGGGGGGRGGSGGYDASADLAYLDSQENTLRNLLGRSSNTLNQGLTNLNDSYNRQVSGVNQNRSRALEDFGVRREDTTRGKDAALGKVDTNARTLNDSLRRILGMAAGSGSSAYQYAAPEAVARQASGQRGEVLSNYGENERNLGLAERRAEEDFKAALDDLFQQRQGKERELRSGVLESEQDIQRQLGDLSGQRAQLRGGGAGAIRAAQAPYEAGISDRQSQIDRLFDQFRSPMLTPREVTVQTPQLRDYLVDRAGINANQQADEPMRNSPYSYFLRRNQDEMA